MKIYKYTKEQFESLSPHEPDIPESELEQIGQRDFEILWDDLMSGKYKMIHANHTRGHLRVYAEPNDSDSK